MRTLVLFVGLSLAATLTLAQADEPYGIKETTTPAEGTPLLREWQSMPHKLQQDAAIVAECRKKPALCKAAVKWAVALIDEVKQLEESDRVQRVHEAVNSRLNFVFDYEQWGATEPIKSKWGKDSERWSSPLDAAESGMGDCEEYVNLKLFVLWQAGVSLLDMRVVLLKYSGLQESHVILAVRKKAKAWSILDDRVIKGDSFPQILGVLAPYEVPSATVVAGVLLKGV